MNNEAILKKLQNSYDSLKYFDIKNNILYFKNENITYSLPISVVNFASLNPNIFLLKPRDVYRIIYLLELLIKENISENDIEFIKQYTQKYLNLETMRLENQNVDELEINCLGIPIYASYEPEYSGSPTSKLIDELLQNHSENVQKGNSKVQRLVLTNPNFPTEYDETSSIYDVGKAGFAAILMIASTVLLTSLYIAFYIIGK